MMDVSMDHAVSRRTAGKLLVELAAPAMGGSVLTGQLGADSKVRAVKGTHFIQEDSPAKIGTALADFVGATRG